MSNILTQFLNKMDEKHIRVVPKPGSTTSLLLSNDIHDKEEAEDIFVKLFTRLSGYYKKKFGEIKGDIESATQHMNDAIDSKYKPPVSIEYLSIPTVIYSAYDAGELNYTIPVDDANITLGSIDNFIPNQKFSAYLNSLVKGKLTDTYSIVQRILDGENIYGRLERGVYGIDSIFIAYAIVSSLDRNNPIDGSYGTIDQYRIALDYLEARLGRTITEYIKKYEDASANNTLVISNIDNVAIVHKQISNIYFKKYTLETLFGIAMLGIVKLSLDNVENVKHKADVKWYSFYNKMVIAKENDSVSHYRNAYDTVLVEVYNREKSNIPLVDARNELSKYLKSLTLGELSDMQKVISYIYGVILYPKTGLISFTQYMIDYKKRYSNMSNEELAGIAISEMVMDLIVSELIISK